MNNPWWLWSIGIPRRRIMDGWPTWLRRTVKGLGWTAAVLALGIGVLAWRAFTPPDVPVTTREYRAADEQAQINVLVSKATAVIAHQPGADTLLQRDAHATPHGCVKAVMTVDSTIPDRLRQGVFTEPGRPYRAWVRFSNGTMADDRENDARGMAIKLMGVEGPKLLTPEQDPEQSTQDFVMVNYPTFFLADLHDYEAFFDFQAAGEPIKYFFQGRNPLRWKMREFVEGMKMLTQKVPSPLATRYFSMTAYRFGPHNIKFSAQPCDASVLDRRMPRRPGPSYLREALIADLDSAGACFDFKVQVQDPTALMPIEDPSVPWDEEVSPYMKVARLEIARQEFATPEQDAFCEQLQFAPWHAVPAQRPLGRLNRVREVVYREVSKRRHMGNGIPVSEPHGWCLDLTPGGFCPAGEGPYPPSREPTQILIETGGAP